MGKRDGRIGKIYDSSAVGKKIFYLEKHKNMG